MLQGVEYVRSMGVGATSPKLFRDNQGGLQVVKLQQGRKGSKVLVNEMLAAMLGQKLELCFPPGDMILLPSGPWQGLHFACRYLTEVCYLTRGNLSLPANKRDMAGTILFDHLFFNQNRTLNRKDLLLRREEQGGYRIYAVDNSRLFQRGSWTTRMLDRMADKIMIHCHYVYHDLLRQYLRPDDLFYYAHKMLNVTYEEIRALIARIPWEWMQSAAERQALAECVFARCERAEDIAGRLAELIPNGYRCANVDVGE